MDNSDSQNLSYTTSMIGFSLSIIEKLEDGYRKDQHFAVIYDAIKKKVDLKTSTLSEQIPPSDVLPYDIFSKLDKLAPDKVEYNNFQGRMCYGHLILYMKDPLDGYLRLCVPSNCHKDFFKNAYDNATHTGFHRAYARLRHNYYIRSLSTTLWDYISACPTCQRNKPSNHKLYGTLQLIDSLALPFETVTMDLIVKLSDSTQDGKTHNSIMTITDKLTKMVTLILSREDYFIQDWAQVFFTHYYHRRRVPQRIITDKSKVFLSKFWQSLFWILRIDLLVMTAYHP